MSGTSAPAVVEQTTPLTTVPVTATGLRRGRVLGLPLGIALQAVNAAGDGLVMVALANRVFEVWHASWAVAAVFIAVTVPVTALAPVAGLLLDRLPMRRTLVVAAAAEAIIAIALVLAGGLTATLVLSAGFGVCAAVLQPGLAALVPQLAAPERLTRANGYMQAATWIGYTIGPLIAGLAITTSGSALALWLTAALYAAAAAGLALLSSSLGSGPLPGDAFPPRQNPARQSRHRRGPSPRSLTAGISYLRSDVDAGMLVVIVGIMAGFTNMAVVAEVVFAERVLHAGAAGYALLVAGWTAGMVLGTLAGGRLRKRWLMIAALAGTVLTGAGVVLAGLALTLWQAIVAYAAGGLANGVETVSTRSFIGHRVPAEVAGRVFAVYSGIIFGGISAGMAVAAGLLTVLGARELLLVSGTGAIMAGLAGIAIYAARARRSAASRAPADIG